MPKVNIPKDEPVPEAWYRARITGIEEKETGKGDPMWKLELTIIEGDQEERVVRDNLVFSTAAAKRLRVFAKALSLPYEGDVDFQSSAVAGRDVMIKVVNEEYNGELQNKVDFAGYKAAPDRDDSRNGNIERPVRGPGGDDIPF